MSFLTFAVMIHFILMFRYNVFGIVGFLLCAVLFLLFNITVSGNDPRNVMDGKGHLLYEILIYNIIIIID
jgi:hypothetical protein